MQRDAVVKGRPAANRDRKSVAGGLPPGVGGVKIGGGGGAAGDPKGGRGGAQGAKPKGTEVLIEQWRWVYSQFSCCLIKVNCFISY